MQVKKCSIFSLRIRSLSHLNTMATILRVQTDSDGVIIGYGCAFEALTAAQEDAIGRYINYVQLLMRAKQGEQD